MTGFWRTLSVGILAAAFAMPALAGDQKRDRKRDGSCGTNVRQQDNTGGEVLSAKKTQQRKRDGSCGGQGTGQQQRKRDGSCQ